MHQSFKLYLSNTIFYIHLDNLITKLAIVLYIDFDYAKNDVLELYCIQFKLHKCYNFVKIILNL